MIASAPWQDCTVRVGPLTNIPALLVELGCDPGPILHRTGFTPDVLSNPDNPISYLKGSRLIAECVAASKCDHFGLLMGERAGPSHLGIAGFMLRSASTVRQALEALVENLDLHDRGTSCTLEVEADYSRLSVLIHQPGVSAIEQIYDLSAVLMYQVMRTLLGKDWVATSVLLVRQRPRDTTPFQQFFRTALFFDSDSCSISFPTYLLDRELSTADPLLYHHLQEEADTLHRTQPHELADMLPAMLQRGLLLNQFSAESIAGAFGVHERTLHRRLRSAGTSYRQELDRVRESLSTQLLESTSLPVCDIATSLGYADSSGFIRAFRRWTGFSPARWRKHHGLH
jgi:AraC-like DNA-binding protein